MKPRGNPQVHSCGAVRSGGHRRKPLLFARCATEYQNPHPQGRPFDRAQGKRVGHTREEKKEPAGAGSTSLFVAGAGFFVESLEQFGGADDLAVKSAGDQGVALDFALFSASDRNAIDL